jgi:hypothetical protein
MRHFSTPRWSAVLVGMFLLVIGPGLASAASLSFIEPLSGVEGPTAVQFDGFQCNPLATNSGPDNEYAHFEGCWQTTPPPGLAPVAAGTADAYLIEVPGDSHPGAISDIIHVVFNVDPDGLAHVVADFVSSPTGAPIEYPPAGIVGVVESNSMQLMNDFFYFIDQATGQVTKVELPGGIEILARSDIGSAVPSRPATWGSLKVLYR